MERKEMYRNNYWKQQKLKWNQFITKIKFRKWIVRHQIVNEQCSCGTKNVKQQSEYCEYFVYTYSEVEQMLKMASVCILQNFLF